MSVMAQNFDIPINEETRTKRNILNRFYFEKSQRVMPQKKKKKDMDKLSHNELYEIKYKNI